MFCGDNVEHNINKQGDYYEITKGDEVQLQDGSWVEIEHLCPNVILENNELVINIIECDNYYKLFTQQKEGDSV